MVCCPGRLPACAVPAAACLPLACTCTCAHVCLETPDYAASQCTYACLSCCRICMYSQRLSDAVSSCAAVKYAVCTVGNLPGEDSMASEQAAEASELELGQLLCLTLHLLLMEAQLLCAAAIPDVRSCGHLLMLHHRHLHLQQLQIRAGGKPAVPDLQFKPIMASTMLASPQCLICNSNL